MRKTLIALTLGAETTSEARRAMEAWAAQADLVELRLDAMKTYDLRELLDNRPCPVIVTNRPVWEGGHFNGEEHDRLTTLIHAAELGAEHIDCELDCAGKLARKDIGRAKLIVSKHDFKRTPDLTALHRRCCENGADIAKVVGMAETVTDSIKALDLMRTSSTPTIALTMGAQGIISRILAMKYGAYLTFASLGRTGQDLAPGQLSLEAMRRVYHAHIIDGETAVYGYLTPGCPFEETLARANDRLRSAGRNAVVVPIEIRGENPSAVVEAYRRSGLQGFAMHARFGESCVQCADALDTSAMRAGRVDGIVNEGERWMGLAFDVPPLEGTTAIWANGV